jgi:hypothetical protein
MKEFNEFKELGRARLPKNLDRYTKRVVSLWYLVTLRQHARRAVGRASHGSAGEQA